MLKQPVDAFVGDRTCDLPITSQTPYIIRQLLTIQR